MTKPCSRSYRQIFQRYGLCARPLIQTRDSKKHIHKHRQKHGPVKALNVVVLLWFISRVIKLLFSGADKWNKLLGNISSKKFIF